MADKSPAVATPPHGGTDLATISSQAELITRVNEALAKYRKAGYNVLGPLGFGHLPSFMIPVLKTVLIDTDPAHQWIYRPGGETWGLGKPALASIAAAAGISWDWVASGRPRYEVGPRQIPYQAVGHWIDFSGERVQIIGDYVLDLDAREEELRRSTEKKARTEPQWMPGPGGKKQQRMLKPDEIGPWIADKVQGEMIQLKKHAHARAQTGAMERAVRWALGLRSAYTLDELKHPFIVPRLVINADSQDPTVRQFFLAVHTGYVKELYGSQTVARSSLPAMGQDLGTGEIIDLSLGEVVDAGPGSSAEADRGTQRPADAAAATATEGEPPSQAPPMTGASPAPTGSVAQAPATAEAVDQRHAHFEQPRDEVRDPEEDARTAWRARMDSSTTKEERLAVLRRLMPHRGRDEKDLTIPLKQFNEQDIEDYFEWLLRLKKGVLKPPTDAPPAAPGAGHAAPQPRP